MGLPSKLMVSLSSIFTSALKVPSMYAWDYIQELEYRECCGINKATFWTHLIFQVIHQSMSAFVREVNNLFENISFFLITSMLTTCPKDRRLYTLCTLELDETRLNILGIGLIRTTWSLSITFQLNQGNQKINYLIIDRKQQTLRDN